MRPEFRREIIAHEPEEYNENFDLKFLFFLVPERLKVCYNSGTPRERGIMNKFYFFPVNGEPCVLSARTFDAAVGEALSYGCRGRVMGRANWGSQFYEQWI